MLENSYVVLQRREEFLRGEDHWCLRAEVRQAVKYRREWDGSRVRIARWAARYLRKAGGWGEVPVGQRAVLPLVTANPLGSLEVMRQRAGVMVRWRWIDRVTRARDLDRLAAACSTTR